MTQNHVTRRYLFKLYPTVEQAIILHEQRKMMADLWNALKQRREDVYRCERRSLTYFDLTNEITALRHECPEWADIPAITAHRVAKWLTDSYQAFFRRLKAGEEPGYPGWKRREYATTIPLGTMDKTGWRIEQRDDNPILWRLHYKSVADVKNRASWTKARGRMPARRDSESLRTRWSISRLGGDTESGAMTRLGGDTESIANTTNRLGSDTESTRRSDASYRNNRLGGDTERTSSRSNNRLGGNKPRGEYRPADHNDRLGGDTERRIAPDDSRLGGYTENRDRLRSLRRARAENPIPISAWRNADIIWRAGVWWLSVCVDIEPRREQPASRLYQEPVTVSFDLIDEFALVNGIAETPAELLDALALDAEVDRLKSDRDIEFPRGKKFSDDERERFNETNGEIAKLSAFIVRKRRNALHKWSARIIERASDLTIIEPPVRDAIKTPRGNEKRWGAQVETVSMLNRHVLSQAPMTAIQMLRYKAEEAGIRCDIVSDVAPVIAVGGDLVNAGKQLRHARRAAKRKAA